MNQAEILIAARSFVRRALEKDSSGHDWWHIHRVTQTALQLAKAENADMFVVELAALLHDIADEKINESKEAGLKTVADWLKNHHVPEAETQHIMEIINTMSYGGGGGKPMRTPEGKIVQDADRLDAIGAIGIARTFAYAGWKGHLMHHPERPPRENLTKEAYRSSEGTAINHFYEKLLKLKNLMNTQTGKTLAEERHAYMEGFLEQFYKEWQ